MQDFKRPVLRKLKQFCSISSLVCVISCSTKIQVDPYAMDRKESLLDLSKKQKRTRYQLKNKTAPAETLYSVDFTIAEKKPFYRNLYLLNSYYRILERRTSWVEISKHLFGASHKAHELEKANGKMPLLKGHIVYFNDSSRPFDLKNMIEFPSKASKSIAKTNFKQKNSKTFQIARSTQSAKNYVIQKGDTLWSISEKHYNSGFSWKKIHQANSYIQNPHKISIGQNIILPELKVKNLARKKASQPKQTLRKPAAHVSTRMTLEESQSLIHKKLQKIRTPKTTFNKPQGVPQIAPQTQEISEHQKKKAPLKEIENENKAQKKLESPRDPASESVSKQKSLIKRLAFFFFIALIGASFFAFILFKQN